MRLGDLVYYFTYYTGIRYIWKKIYPTEYNFDWYVSCTHNTTNINITNPVLVTQKK